LFDLTQAVFWQTQIPARRTKKALGAGQETSAGWVLQWMAELGQRLPSRADYLSVVNR
jgi:hypothetical protein